MFRNLTEESFEHVCIKHEGNHAAVPFYKLACLTSSINYLLPSWQRDLGLPS